MDIKFSRQFKTFIFCLSVNSSLMNCGAMAEREKETFVQRCVCIFDSYPSHSGYNHDRIQNKSMP